MDPFRTLFRTLSSVRGDRIFHPQGRVFAGRWRIDRADPRVAGAQVLSAGFERDALVRLSRGTGLPEWLPDFVGVAIRLADVYGPGAHQDLLVNSSVHTPVLNHVLVPSPGWFARPSTTSLPYRAGGGKLVLLGLLPPDEPEPGPSVDALEARIARHPVSWGIAIAPLGGRWSRIGTLTVQQRTPERDTLRFDPFNTGGGLEPATVLNRMRRAAYRGSREGAPVAD